MQVVLHDGEGHSFWLAPNREPEKLQAAKIDWVFMVWVPKNWENLRRLPADLNPPGAKDEDGPLAQIDVYTGGNVRWQDVVVPKGLKIVDQRLQAHGFTLADGTVLEGKVTAQTTGKPLAAKVRLEAVEPQAKGGYAHPVIARASADVKGHWVLKNAPGGWARIVVEANGFVPRVAGYAKYDGQPCWQAYSGLPSSSTTRPVTGPERARLVSVFLSQGAAWAAPSKSLVAFTVKAAMLSAAGAAGFSAPVTLPARHGEPCRASPRASSLRARFSRVAMVASGLPRSRAASLRLFPSSSHKTTAKERLSGCFKSSAISPILPFYT